MNPAHTVVADVGPTFGLLAIALDGGAPHVCRPARPGPHVTAAEARGGSWWMLRQHPPLVAPLPRWPELHVVVATPQVAWHDQTVKHALPRDVPTMKHVRQSAVSAAVKHALHERNASLLRDVWEDALVGDAVGPRTTGFFPAQRAALDAGALAFGLCGAGPTVAALALGDDATRVADAIEAVLRAHALACCVDVRGVAELRD